MPTVYDHKEQKVKPAILPPGAFAAIGSIVRSFAEIEDIINLWIAKLSSTTEGITSILMGRMGFSTKLQTLEFLAALHGEKQKKIYSNLFGEGFSAVLDCRNAVAHGVFLGKTVSGRRYAFLTSHKLKPTDSILSQEVISYALADLRGFAEIAKGAIPIMEMALGLQASRQRHLRQSLTPHRKGQQQKSQAGGQKPQQPASQAKVPKLSRRQQREARIQAAKAAAARR